MTEVSFNAETCTTINKSQLRRHQPYTHTNVFTAVLYVNLD